jgi:translation initiation factor 2A
MTGPLEAAPQGSIAIAVTSAPKPAGSSQTPFLSSFHFFPLMFSHSAAPTGAYRPPGARGLATSNVYKREDEGGAAYSSNGVDPFPRNAGNGAAVPGAGRAARPRTIPGAAGAAAPEDPLANRRKKKGGKGKNGENGATSAPNSGASTPLPPPVPAVVEVVPEPESAASLSPEDKKRRAIIKKLTAIEQLKAKKASGEKLELTQHKKLDGEAELRKELAALG